MKNAIEELRGSSGYFHPEQPSFTGNTLLARVFTISCSTLQLKRSITASSQSLSSFSTCSIAFSASLYRYKTHTKTHRKWVSRGYYYYSVNLFSRYFFDRVLYPITTVTFAHLHAHESTTLAKVSFGPVWGQLNGAFSICQGLRVLLQAVIAIGTIPKEPTGRNLKMQKEYNACV